MPYEGNNPSITHVERIAAGGFGEVHKVKAAKISSLT